MADMKFASVGYVVERWATQEQIDRQSDDYRKAKENMGEEKWNEILGQVGTTFQNYIDGKVEPHWYGIKGGDKYSWAKALKERMEHETKIKHRVVKAGFPHKEVWSGYTILNWN